MSIADAAAAAVLYWSREDAIKMVAIAGPESSYDPRANGDHILNFSPADRVKYDPYDCDGYLSFGYWQIFQGVHHSKLRVATYSNNPCVWRDYLFVPVNNARTAYQVWVEQGFAAWTAYNDRSYLAYMAAAEAAVDEALGPRPPVVVPLPPAVVPPSAAVAPPPAPVPPPPSL